MAEAEVLRLEDYPRRQREQLPEGILYKFHFLTRRQRKLVIESEAARIILTIMQESRNLHRLYNKHDFYEDVSSRFRDIYNILGTSRLVDKTIDNLVDANFINPSIQDRFRFNPKFYPEKRAGEELYELLNDSSPTAQGLNSTV